LTGRTGSSRSSRAELALLAATLLSALWFSLPRLGAMLREAWSMRALPLAQRRAHLFGDLYTSSMRIRASLAPGQPVAIVMRNKDDGDLGVYVNHWLAPHPTRMYFGADAYRRDPHAPPTIAFIDRRATWDVRLVRELP
jgi:hypothetical protein